MKKNLMEFRIEFEVSLSNKYDLKIVQVYATTSISTQKKLDKFYDKLNEEITTSKTHYFITIGDFNAKIGSGNKSCFSKFLHGTQNDREDLTNFAISRNLKFCNTPYRKKLSKKWTWTWLNLVLSQPS